MVSSNTIFSLVKHLLKKKKNAAIGPENVTIGPLNLVWELKNAAIGPKNVTIGLKNATIGLLEYGAMVD